MAIDPDLHVLQVADRYRAAPPIVRAAVRAILDHEDRVDPIGYDLSYYQEDLPAAVTKAIEPWKQIDGS